MPEHRTTITTFIALLASCLAGTGCVTTENDELVADDDLAADQSTAAAARLTGNAIGVIPESGVNCPGDRISITLWNESDDNNNQRSPWYGDWVSNRMTYLRFCKVSSQGFKPARGTLAAMNYAVLKLGASCPAGSSTVIRYFDNNDLNGAHVSWYQETAQLPSKYGGMGGNNVWLHLCVFEATASGSTAPFPNLGFSYGVMGGAALPGAQATGWVRTDDEDDDNNNSWDNPSGIEMSTVMEGNDNTKIYTVRVR